MIAAGTSPNVIYEKEHPGTFRLDKWKQFFQAYAVSNNELIEVDPNHEQGFFTSYQHPTEKSKLVTFYGDNHPRYNGNVVKAMASAKDGYPRVVELFADEIAKLNPAEQPAREARWSKLVTTLDDQLLARVERVVRLTPTIVEVIVRAPAAARHYHPGQFYRLQNFERLSPHIRLDDHVASMLMEGIALTGAWVDQE